MIKAKSDEIGQHFRNENIAMNDSVPTFYQSKLVEKMDQST